MDTGSRTGIVYTADDGTDGTDSFRHSIRNLAAWAETQGALYAQGLLSARPAAGKIGRLYRATDDVTGVIYWDDGSTWQAIGEPAAIDAAANVGSLRTLGAGSLQAAAGNHAHLGSAMYGSSYTTPGGVASSATYDSPASVTFTTTATNTKWLVEIDAAIQWLTNAGNPNITVSAKVDGSYVSSTAWRLVVQASNVGYETYGDTLTGRVVVTLASTGSHTILAAITNGGPDAITRGSTTITVTQVS